MFKTTELLMLTKYKVATLPILNHFITEHLHALFKVNMEFFICIWFSYKHYLFLVQNIFLRPLCISKILCCLYKVVRLSSISRLLVFNQFGFKLFHFKFNSLNSFDYFNDIPSLDVRDTALN